MATAGSDGTDQPTTDPDKPTTESDEPDNSSTSEAPSDKNSKPDESLDSTPTSESIESPADPTSSGEQKEAPVDKVKKTQSTGSKQKQKKGKPGRVAKVPAPNPKAQKLNADYNLIPIPLPYLDTLASRVGNTPRPTEIKNHFFHGMRHIQNNRIAEGEMKLRDAAKAANDLVNGPKGKKKNKSKAARVDVESLAYATMGLGYACFRSGKIKIASRCYLRSHALWAKLNPGDDKSHCLISILADSVILLILAGDVDLAKPQLKRFLKLVEENRKITGSDLKPEEILLIARGIARVACVASGQRGASLRVKKDQKVKGGDEQKKSRPISFRVPPKTVYGLYEDSVVWIQKIKQFGTVAQKELIEILQLYQDFLQTQIKPCDSTTTTESTTTTMTSTTTSKKTKGETTFQNKLDEVTKLLNSLTSHQLKRPGNE